MASIFDLPSVWRSRLQPASFNGARFHCEANSRESGRRAVEHEFPKKELPYGEDMGRHARAFSIRGYCIVYPGDGDSLFQRDYRQPRDALIAQLEKPGAGTLQLPTQPSQRVICTRYRLSEEERFGGFCSFDMTFIEAGADPSQLVGSVATGAVAQTAAQTLRDNVQQSLAKPDPPPVGEKV